MAAYLEGATGISNSEIRFGYFRGKLQELQYPHLGTAQDSWLEVLLHQAGEPRLQLLEWLLMQLYKGLEDTYFANCLKESVDVRVRKLFFIMQTLGLCSEGELSVVQDAMPVKRNGEVLTKLVDLALQSNKLARLSLEESPRNLKHRSGLRNVELLKTILDEVDLSDLFSTKISLVPPDICQDLKSFAPMDSGSTEMPSLDVDDGYVKIFNVVETEELKLKQLREELFNESKASEDQFDQLSADFSQTVISLQKTADDFCNHYAAIEPLLQNPSIATPNLGETLADICQSQEEFVKFIQSLSSAHSSYQQLQEMQKAIHQDSSLKCKLFKEFLFEEATSVLERASHCLH